MQASHCRAASFICPRPGRSGGAKEEAALAGRFRRWLAGCRKGGSRTGRGLKPQRLSHVRDAGCKLGGTETGPLIRSSELSGKLNTFRFTLPVT